MKNGRLILWKAIAIFDILETSWQTGLFLAKDDSENYSQDQ